MLRRNWQEKVGLFDESLRSYEDWDMWLRLAQAGCKMAWVPQPVAYYRFHSAQMTRIGSQMTKATFAVLDKVYADPDLPESWLSLKDRAYASAYLRAAAQAYLAEDFDHAKTCLSKAIERNPELAKSEGRMLADQFVAWSDIPKVRHPLQFLETIYSNLPDCVATLHAQRKQHLGKVAIQLAFEAYQRGDYRVTYSAALRAFRYRPQFLMNRGALAIFLRSGLKQRRQPGNGSIGGG
jgi:tetratricopeptide (TPR) repeat protein